MLENLKTKANDLLQRFKGDRYIHGSGCLDKAGELAKDLGSTTVIIANHPDKRWKAEILDTVRSALQSSGVRLASQKIIRGARANAPREDVYRMEAEILHADPGCITVVGSGSTIDAAKAANALSCLGKTTNDLEDYFGVSQVTGIAEKSGLKLRPLLAVMTAASSSAHLTKYSNITDPAAGQKKLIVDEIVVPHRALFDYEVTASSPKHLTLDGGMDGIAHNLEVYYGAKENQDLIEEIALTGIELSVAGLKLFSEDAGSAEARELLGLATDLGGYAIMVGGTNGGHLTSFSLVDVLSHGRACALLNPYYTVFFAPAIEERLRKIAEIYRRQGFFEDDPSSPSGRELGIAVAEGMIAFSKSVGFPTKLSQVEGFSQAHIERALNAAKNPQLEMKLKAMPVPLDSSLIDEYMGAILQAAAKGDLSLIKNL
jgi:alcohol dehydrogenase class IV